MNARSLALSFALFGTGAVASAEEMMMSSTELTHEEEVFFESRIRPALIEHCHQCHSREGDKIKGGLLLDTREAARAGGDSGPAVVPHDPVESLLLAAIEYEDSTLEMPPKYKLDDEVIADFRKWIEMGAPDPRERRPKPGAPEEYTSTVDLESGREHWAYQPPVPPEIPAVGGSPGIRNSIDAFVRAAHASQGLEAAPPAEGHDFLRRLTFDLTGLPPTPSEIADFVPAYREDPDGAVAETVSRLLDSPRSGERLGRRWLDVARYAESTGKEVNATFPHAWRYRDYVIDAFQADKPFDEFIAEQIAGDLLPAETPEERAEHIVATGFLAIGAKGLNEQNARQFRFDLVDEQIDTTTQAFLATTAACARCHDHKFDPIPMSDYYAMAGIFLSSDTLFGTAEALQNRKATELIALPGKAVSGTEGKPLSEMIELEYQLVQLRERLDELSSGALEARREGDGDTAQRLRIQSLGVRNRIGLTERQLASHDDAGNPLSLAMGTRDREEPFDSQVLIRGEEDNPTAERVPRGFLQVVSTGGEPAIPSDESGRRQLAEWIASPENPLTARVFVNRVWSWLFGAGLVRSVDNFGMSGEAPSHPELLDYLAMRFVELDWSVKALIYEITTSETYRMSSRFDPEYFRVDPGNRYLWRTEKRRLDAESIRDASLAVSGRLDLTRPVGSVVAEAGDGFVGRGVSEDQINAQSTHRSVYLPIVRGLLPESLSLFDFADPSLISGQREITTVPSQALYMMNSDFMIANGEAMARDLVHENGLRGRALIREAFLRCYSRPPTEEEVRKTLAYVDRFLETAEEHGIDLEEARQLAVNTFCQSLIGSAEFRYLN